MIKARTKANLSVAMGLSEVEDTTPQDGVPRPSSAPTTRDESKQARRHIQAQDPTEEGYRQERDITLRPKSCLPNFGQLSGNYSLSITSQ